MPLESLIDKKDLRYVFLGGKGGVGKTICASAIAITLAKYHDRVLIVSTDPAHSISDCFDQDLTGGEPKRIEGVEGNLFGLELEAQQGLEQFKALSSSGMPGTQNPFGFNPFPSSPSNEVDVNIDDMDDIDISEDGTTSAPGFDFQNALGLGADLLGQDSIPPGSDEAFAFGKLLELIEGNDYDLVVFDTAPTGHTLRFLSLPDYLDSFVGKMLKMRMRFGGLFKSIRNIFSGSNENEDDDSLKMLEALKKTITKARIELADDAKTEFVPVTIPTMMALYETERLITTLKDYSIPVEHIIVNQLIPPSKDCPFCVKRFEIQENTMLTLKQYFGEFNLTEVPMVPQEIRGIEQLQMLSTILFK